jgi:hypothetical protein
LRQKASEESAKTYQMSPVTDVSDIIEKLGASYRARNYSGDFKSFRDAYPLLEDAATAARSYWPEHFQLGRKIP